jgi:D-aminopeptidase
LGLAKTGGIASNGSGDYVITVSTTEGNRIPYMSNVITQKTETLRNDAISPLFLATIEATEEAIINSLFAATSVSGKDGHRIEALPIKKVLKIIEAYQAPKK